MVPGLLEAWGGDLRVTYGASGSLRRQVEAGAPLEAVLFASPEPVDALIAAGLADPGTRRRVATNALVLIGPVGSPLTFDTLADLPAGARLAVGDPRVVPAGAYAEVALRRLGAWAPLQTRLVFGGDVSTVLVHTRRGEVDAGIVYATDVRGVTDVAVLDRAPAPVAEVVVAATTAAGDAARDFLAFVASPAGAALFAEHGFGAANP